MGPRGRFRARPRHARASWTPIASSPAAPPGGPPARGSGPPPAWSSCTKGFWSDCSAAAHASDPGSDTHGATGDTGLSGLKVGDLYDLGETLGSGSYSVVRRARDRRTGKEFAVKCIDRSKLSRHDLAALANEVAIMRKLDHPHIIRLTDYFEDGPMCYIVTELVTGGELFDRIVEKKFY